MDKTLASAKIALHPTRVAVLFAILLMIVALIGGLVRYPVDPYVQEVSALSANLHRGQAIFQANCSVCHGLAGNGNIGPSLQGVSQRKSTQRLIEQVISGKTPPMPKFQPTPQNMADLLLYLESL